VNKKTILTLSVALWTLLALVPIQVGAASQKTGSQGAGSQGTGSQGAGSQPGGAAQQQSPQGGQPGSQTSPGSGITNGTLPIEATILAYKAFSASANEMANAINKKISKEPTDRIVIICTTDDIAAITQLRIVLGQAQILTGRLYALARDLNDQLPERKKEAPSEKPAGPFIASPSDVTTLIQTLGNITAVTETLSSYAAALNDATLVSVLAGKIKAPSVLVPSVSPPDLMTQRDLNGTCIMDALVVLDRARDYAVGREIEAQRLKKTDARTTSLVQRIQAASTAVDVFVNSLLTGQQYSLSNQDTAAAGNTAPSPKGAKSNANNPAPTAASLQVQGIQPSPAPSGTVLQKILYADLLLHSVSGKGSTVVLLAVHALESGGSQLTKSNMFLGNRYFFSGGAVASFGLYSYEGRPQCSGVAYGYRGFTRQGEIEDAINEKKSQAIVTLTTDCQ